MDVVDVEVEGGVLADQAMSVKAACVPAVMWSRVWMVAFVPTMK